MLVMPGTVFTADPVVNKLRQIEVLQGEGRSVQQPREEAGTTDVEQKQSEVLSGLSPKTLHGLFFLVVPVPSHQRRPHSSRPRRSISRLVDRRGSDSRISTW